MGVYEELVARGLILRLQMKKKSKSLSTMVKLYFISVLTLLLTAYM